MITNQIFLKPRYRLTYSLGNQLEKLLLINYNNRWKDVYVSVYNFKGDRPTSFNAIVDKIFFDFDPIDGDDEIAFNNCKKLVNYLMSNELSHQVFYSGRGFHVFINLKDGDNLKNPKVAIKSFSQKLHKKLDIISDSSVIGDLMRVRRCPNTMNMKTLRYCIPLLDMEIMNLTLNEIKNLSKSPRFINSKNYLNKLELKKYDSNDEHVHQVVKKDTKISFSNYPACIRHMMQNEELGYRQRGFLILYLRDSGYTLDEIYYIMENILTPEKFNHCANEEHQIEYLYNREDIIYPSCSRLQIEGLCFNCGGNTLYV